MVEEKLRKPIRDFEGYYEVDADGNIYSVKRAITIEDHGKTYQKPVAEKKLAVCKCNNGYVSVGLYKKGKGTHRWVHRIVAEAFIPNPHNYPCANHKDEDKTNNSASNLEWCTYSYNITYNGASKRAGKKRKGRQSPYRETLTAHGKTKSTIEWAEESGIKYTTLKKRLLNGWAPEEAVDSKLHKSRWERRNGSID